MLTLMKENATVCNEALSGLLTKKDSSGMQ